MSALAGIFKYDSRNHVTWPELADLARGIDRIGPDGGGEYLQSNVGMVYRAFHTTAESHFERQPLVSEGFVLAWDGRLDNRDEIRARVAANHQESTADADLVFAAYREWGESCFAELMGDWALAVWDPIRKRLILARDYIGVRRLFYRLDQDGIAWCSILEPLVLQSPCKLQLDLEYLAGYLYPRPPVETTPYRGIRAVVPANFLTFQQDSRQATKRYWALNPFGAIRHSSDADYEQHFRELFRSSVERRLRADRPILAELSGGLDSSSVVCMADDIHRKSQGMPIETLSYFDTDEPSGDERPYFSLVEKRRGRIGYHISKTQFDAQNRNESLKPLPEHCFSASPGYFAESLSWAGVIDGILKTTGARVVLSGLGGDELLGGIQFEAPELAEHLVAGNLIPFARSLYRWSFARRKTVFQLLCDTAQLLKAGHNPQSLTASNARRFSWACLAPSALHPALEAFADWRLLTPTQLTLEWVRYGLASQLTCTDPALVGCREYRHPLLDRELFAFLASIPRTQVVQAGHRRHLMRRALRGIVPDGVLFRKTKAFGLRNAMAILSEHASVIDSLFADNWVSDGIVVNTSLLREALRAAQQGLSSDGMQLISTIAIEQWLRSRQILDCLEVPASLACNGRRPTVPD
jgi:asparagine synthase (glutamine-hydrolysing)